MGTGRSFNKDPKTRPKKKTRERKRRIKTQQKRLIALGMSEDAVSRLNTEQIRTLLKRPAKISVETKPKANKTKAKAKAKTKSK
ncbi:hypothetical protein ACFLS1_01045 [Verrucomicrobiota bacterium]